MRGMTLKKAIEILIDHKMQSAFEATSDFEDALKLGIEALKRLNKLRDNYSPYSIAPLPGETEE